MSSTRGTFHTLLEADGELLSLARPSPGGTLTSVLGRQRRLQLWELKLPAQ
jgi:hypothetical protein